ncbi:NAD(+)/NADH kinase, partial [Glaesserella parasuis]
KPRHDIALETHLAVYNWLKDRKYNVLVEEKIATQLNLANPMNIAEIGEWADLVIVIGGDGNMLGMARQLAK